MSAARKRYLARFFPTMAAYVVAVLGVTWMFKNQPPTGELAYAFAVLPALPILGVIAILGRYLIEETDEFIRMRQVIALLIATGLTLSFCATWGFLEFYSDVPKVDIFHATWIFFGAFGIGNGIAGWWYR